MEYKYLEISFSSPKSGCFKNICVMAMHLVFQKHYGLGSLLCLLTNSRV